MSEAKDRLKSQVEALRSLVRKAKSVEEQLAKGSEDRGSGAKERQPTNPRRKRT